LVVALLKVAFYAIAPPRYRGGALMSPQIFYVESTAEKRLEVIASKISATTARQQGSALFWL
jgi:hypothetical protein